MAIAKKISNEVRGWAGLAIIIVIASIILLKFKTSNAGNITCASGYVYNTTADNCYLSSNASITSVIGDTAGVLDTFVTAIAEPQNWVVIVIVAIIGIAIFKYFQRKKGAY